MPNNPRQGNDDFDTGEAVGYVPHGRKGNPHPRPEKPGVPDGGDAERVDHRPDNRRGDYGQGGGVVELDEDLGNLR